MSSNQGSSLVDRIIGWLRGLLGGAANGGQGAGTTTDRGTGGGFASTLSERGQGVADRATGELKQAGSAAAGQAAEVKRDVSERVSDINQAVNEQVSKLGRPLESDDAGTGDSSSTQQAGVGADRDDLAHTTDRPGDMDQATSTGTTAGTTGAAADEFASGGYAPGTTTADDVAAAAEGQTTTDTGRPQDSGNAVSGTTAEIPTAPAPTSMEAATGVTEGDTGEDDDHLGDDTGFDDDLPPGAGNYGSGNLNIGSRGSLGGGAADTAADRRAARREQAATGPGDADAGTSPATGAIAGSEGDSPGVTSMPDTGADAGAPDVGGASPVSDMTADQVDAASSGASGGASETYVTAPDDVTAGQDVPERAGEHGSSGATWGAETPGAGAVDVSSALTDSSATGESGAATAGTGGPFDEDGDLGTIQPAGFDALEGEPPTGDHPDDAGDGTYAATAGDITAAGESSATDLGLADSGDLDATELGSLEDAEDDQLRTQGEAGSGEEGEFPSFVPLGTRTGADLSRTGLYADVRGDEEDLTTDDIERELGGTSGTGEGAEAAASAGMSLDDDASLDTSNFERGSSSAGATFTGPDSGIPSASTEHSPDEAGGDMAGALAGPEGTPIEDALASDAAPLVEPAGGMNADVDTYSAAETADVMATESSPESTTSTAIGEEMASGEEAGDLIDEPASGQPGGVAVDMDAETRPEVRPETGGKYAGAVRGDGTSNTPPGYPVKGNGSSMIYHTPEMPSYRGTKPEWCFATEEDAIAAGFRAPRARNLAKDAGPSPAGGGQDTGAAAGSASAMGREPADRDSVGGTVETTDVAPASELIGTMHDTAGDAASNDTLATDVDNTGSGMVDDFGRGADDVESLQMSSPDDLGAAAGGDEGPAGAVRAGGKECPSGYPIKGNASSMIYHVPGSHSYDNTVPEWCFASEEDAQGAGYRAPKR